MFSTVQRSSLPIIILITNNPFHIHTGYLFNAHFHVIFLCPLPRGFFISRNSINNFHADLVPPMCIIGSADIRFFAIIRITLVLHSSSSQMYLWPLISKISQLTYSDWVKNKVACNFYEREDKIRNGRSKSYEMWRLILGYVVAEISKCREVVNFRKN